MLSARAAAVRRRLPLLAALVLPALLYAPARSAEPATAAEFLSAKREIILLAGERARSPSFDYQTLLKAAENNLRSLHENYQLRRSTPPTNLAGDVQELTGAVQRVRLQRNRGVDVPPDPAARALIDAIWYEYGAQADGIFQDVLLAKQTGAAESQTYWEATARFRRLCEQTANRVIFNPPDGAESDRAVFSLDELRLLKSLEFQERKTKGRSLAVDLGASAPAAGRWDIAPFYASQGMLPQKSPREIGVLTVPPGSRTVTRRRSGENLILRTVEGRGIVYIGSSQKMMSFGYVFIPAGTAYYFEATSDGPLVLEYIALSAA